MQRILIIGGNGSGKTTFAKQLSAAMQLPLVHLDRLYWYGNWQARSREEFDELLFRELEKERWIIDGNYNRTIPCRIQYCDTVFYFDFSTAACLWGVTKRLLKHHGKTRDDMGGQCPERFDASFYKNVLAFNKKHRKHYHAMLNSCKTAHVVIFKNQRQVNAYLRALCAAPHSVS